MRIATWNINGMRARIEYLKHWLREVSPDVVGLQELKMPDEKFPSLEFEALGYHTLTHGQKSWNGVAILSKTPATLIQQGLPKQDEMGSRLIGARVDGLDFFTVYCPNGKNLAHEDYQRKLAWFDDLHGYLDATYQANDDLVVCGDFNIVSAPLDSWDETRFAGDIFHTDAERERMNTLRDWGLVDLWRRLYPDDAGHTWWDYRGGSFHKRQGLRIDLMMATEPVAQRAQSLHIERTWRKKIDELKPSDHGPLWCDLSAAS